MKDKLVKIFIASSGKITALPGMVGPIDVPFIVDAETALAIAMEGHIVYANTVFKGEIRLTEDILLDFMQSYGITDEDIRRKIEESIKLSKEYENLTTVKEIVDKLMKLQGILVPGYESMELIGKSIKAILNSEKLASFKDVENSLVVLDNKIDDNYRKINDSEKIDTFKDIELLFDSVFSDIDIIKKVILSKVQDILNGVYLSSFKDVEDLIAKLFNGDYIHSIKDIEDVLSSLHAQGTDIEIGKGTDYHLTAEYISNTLIYLKQNNSELFNRLMELAIFMSNKSITIDNISLEISKILNSDTIKSFKDVETAVNAVHEQGTDIEIGKGTEFHITAEEISKFMNKTAIDSTEQEIINKSLYIAINAILNSDTIKSFKDVETAVNAVHEQGTDIEIGKGTEFHITAEEISNSLKTISINILANTNTINTINNNMNAILNSNKFKTFFDVELALGTVHTQGSDMELGKGTETHITVDEILVMKEKIESALEAGAVILVESTITSAISKYLPQMPDNQTIYLNSNNKFEARTIKDLSATSSELNAMIGVKSNVQLQLDGIRFDYQSKIEALQGAGGFSGYFETNADKLLASGLGDGIYIVSLDETHSGNTTMWRYKSSSSTWIYLGKFNIEVRDFSSKPINLATEVTGVLPKSRIDISFVNDVEVLKIKVHTPGSDSYLDFGLPTQVSSTEIRNGLDKIKYLTAVNAASLIDDTKSQLFKTYSSSKIESILSSLLTADKVYLKSESDNIFMKSSEYQKHDNFDVINKLSDNDGLLYYNGKSIFENKDIISVDGDFTDETSTLSTVFDLVNFCLIRSVVYPVQSIFYIQNNSKDTDLSLMILVNGDMDILDVLIPPGEKRGYKYNPSYADMKIQIKGSYRLTVAVTAYKLQDFVDLINVKYHSPNSDIALGIGTEYECFARDLSRIVKLLKDINIGFLHNRNEDDYLAYGKEYQISAKEIKNILDTVNPIIQTSVLNITSNPKEVTIPISNTNKTILQFFKCVYDSNTQNIVKLISTFNNVDSADFIGDTDRFIFDGKMYLKDSLSKDAVSTDYQSGRLCIFDYLSQSDIASMGGSIKSAQLKFTPSMRRPKEQSLTPPNGYVRYDNNNANILYDASFTDVYDIDSYNGSRKVSASGTAMIKFNFTGDKIRIYTNVSNLNISNTAAIKITVDGITYTYNEYNVANLNQVCVFELTGLNPLHSHDVLIENVSSNILSLDSVDLSIGSKLQSYNIVHNNTGGIIFKKSVNYYRYDADTSSMVLVTGSNPVESDFISSNTHQIPNSVNILDYSIYVYAQDYTLSSCKIEYLYGTQPSFIRGLNNKSFGSNVSSIDNVQLNISITGDAIFRLVFGDINSNAWYGYKNGTLVDVDTTSYNDIITNGCNINDVALLDSNVLSNFKGGISFGYLIQDNSGKVIIEDISVIVDYLSDLELITDLSKVKVRYQYGTAKITFTDMIGENIVINKI